MAGKVVKMRPLRDFEKAELDRMLAAYEDAIKAKPEGEDRDAGEWRLSEKAAAAASASMLVDALKAEGALPAK